MSTENNQKKLAIEQAERALREQSKALELNKAELSATETHLTKAHSKSDWWSVSDAMTISAAVLLFGCIIMLLATYLLHKGKNADEVLKLFGTIIIIVSAVFLVVAGYTDTQIAPVIGLLGTIAGYLLGRRSSEEMQAATVIRPIEAKPTETKIVETKHEETTPPPAV